MNSVQIRRFFWSVFSRIRLSVFSPNAGKYGPETFRDFSRSEYVLTNENIVNFKRNYQYWTETNLLNQSKQELDFAACHWLYCTPIFNQYFNRKYQPKGCKSSEVSAISRKHRHWSVRLIIERKIAMLWMDFFQASVAFLFPNTLGRSILWFILMYIYINCFFRLATLLLFYAI